MAEQSNQVARELKQLDTKELDPSSLSVRKLRVNGELHMPSIRQPPQAKYMYMVQFKTQKLLEHSTKIVNCSYILVF